MKLFTVIFFALILVSCQPETPEFVNKTYLLKSKIGKITNDFSRKNSTMFLYFMPNNYVRVIQPYTTLHMVTDTTVYWCFQTGDTISIGKAEYAYEVKGDRLFLTQHPFTETLIFLESNSKSW